MNARRPQRRWGWAVALLAAALVLANPSRTLLVAAALGDALRAPVRALEHLRLWFAERKALVAELEALRRSLAAERARRQRERVLATSLRAFAAMDQAVRALARDWAVARVIGSTPEAMSRRIVLAVEAAPNDPVVAEEGLVGLVDAAAHGRAVVRTLFDASLMVLVTDERRRLPLAVQGRGDRLIVRFVPRDAPLRPGDVLYTSGAGGVFPPGIPVARVVSVAPRPGALVMDVQAEPVAEWRTKAFLAVIRR
ncbi:MAG: rod shape-determining protein MreC [Zetaproteobacteria bacterium]|nr:MAG: rod shape-determining protein MreC [Zetaproteobacteria bacterium]